ncbi:hypothetical protein [Helicobacter bilis]|nr:hypothetical protein [Helicobacter bilis]
MDISCWNLVSKTTACHTKPLGEVSNTQSKKDISCLRAQYDKISDSLSL